MTEVITDLHIEASRQVVARSINIAYYDGGQATRDLMHAALDSHELLLLQYLAERGIAVGDLATEYAEGRCWRCGQNVHTVGGSRE